TKKPALCHLSKGGFCFRARLKISKGQVVFFEKITQKISTFKPLPIFILSVLSSLPKARLSKNKIFIVFRFSSEIGRASCREVVYWSCGCSYCYEKMTAAS